jgi:hypothetical protein
MDVAVSGVVGWPSLAKGSIGIVGSYGAWDVTLAALGGGVFVILIVALVGIALIPLFLAIVRQVGSSTRQVGYPHWPDTASFSPRVRPSGNGEQNGEGRSIYGGGEGMSPELQELRFLLVRMDERLSTVERHSEEGRETLKVLVERVTPRSRTTRKQSRDE